LQAGSGGSAAAAPLHPDAVGQGGVAGDLPVLAGGELGGRDHSTVLHGVGKMHGEIEVNAQLRRDVLAIRELLYSEARP